jgi:hypothetical protein
MDTPVQNEVTTLQSDAVALLHNLATRQAHVSFAVLAVLVVFMAVAGFFGYRSLQSYDKMMVAAQKQSDDFKIERTAFVAQLKQDAIDRESISGKQKVIVQVVHDRDTSTNAAIASATAPKSVEAVQADSQNYLGVLPTYIPEQNLLGFTPPSVQRFVSTKIDRDRLFSDWKDTSTNLGLEQQKTSSLTSSLALTTQEEKDAEALATKWEHVAHKTKMRRFLEGLERGGELALTGVATYELGKHSGEKK